MAVYREGYHIIQTYEKLKHRMWNDACDEGVAVNIGDANWNLFHQLIEWYGDKGTRRKTGQNEVQIEVTLIDEWAVSDRRKTMTQATDKFEVHYFKFKHAYPGLIKPDKTTGFFSIQKI